MSCTGPWLPQWSHGASGGSLHLKERCEQARSLRSHSDVVDRSTAIGDRCWANTAWQLPRSMRLIRSAAKSYAGLFASTSRLLGSDALSHNTALLGSSKPSCRCHESFLFSPVARQPFALGGLAAFCRSFPSQKAPSTDEQRGYSGKKPQKNPRNEKGKYAESKDSASEGTPVIKKPSGNSDKPVRPPAPAAEQGQHPESKQADTPSHGDAEQEQQASREGLSGMHKVCSISGMHPFLSSHDCF